MAHWQPKDNIERVGDDNTPVQLVVGRKSAKQVAIHQEDKPDVTQQSPITRAADYVAQGEPAAPAVPPVMVAPPIVAAAPVAPQVTHQQPQPQGQTMSNDHTPCHQHPVQAHPAQNWYGGQPMQYAAQPLVVQQLPAPMHNVQTNQAPDVTYRKGVLGIGSEAFDLTGEMMDSFEFKAKFIMFLQSVLATDLNVQAALFTPNEKKQDAEIAALKVVDSTLKHALQCAFYEDGDIVFPGIKNDCGKEVRVKVPPVNGIKYDVYTSTLSIGSAELVLPVKDMVSAVINSALNAAAMSLPKVKRAEDITDLPIFDRDDMCAPAKSATIAQLSESVMTQGMVELCESGKLVDIEEPSKLLAFGKSCKEIGFSTIASLLKKLNASLLLAPKGQFPLELRGFSQKEGQGELRYPVTVTEKRATAASGRMIASGDSAAGISSSTVIVVAPADDFYLLIGNCLGYIKVDTDAALNAGVADMRLTVAAGAYAQQSADTIGFTAAGQVLTHCCSVTGATFLKAGTPVTLSTWYLGTGIMSPGPLPVEGSLSLIPLGMTSISINPA